MQVYSEGSSSSEALCRWIAITAALQAGLSTLHPKKGQRKCTVRGPPRVKHSAGRHYHHSRSSDRVKHPAPKEGQPQGRVKHPAPWELLLLFFDPAY